VTTVAVFSASGRPGHVSALARHYEFKNERNPFRVDMAPVLERIPVELRRMRDWLPLQDRSLDRREVVGLVSG
jgi:hypothetical protein